MATREDVAQQRKRLETAWKGLQEADQNLAFQTLEIRRQLRIAFSELLKVDQFLGEIEAKAEVQS